MSKFERLEIAPFPERGPYDKDPQVWRDVCLPKYSALLRLLEIAWVHPSTNARIAELLLRKLKLALRPSSSIESDEVHFIISQGFHAYLRMSQAAAAIDTSLRPLLRAALPRFARSVGFLQAYLAFELGLPASTTADGLSGSSSDSSSVEDDKVEASLVENLSCSSHELRLVSLELLQHFSDDDSNEMLLRSMIDAENAPLNPSEIRNMAMSLRQLGKQYSSLGNSTWLREGIPRFLFGMLTVQMAPVWDEAVVVMEVIAQNKTGEEFLSALAFEWLAIPSLRQRSTGGPTGPPQRPVVTDFDCTNVRRLQAAAGLVQQAISVPEEQMLEAFDQKQIKAKPIPDFARSRALKVFNAVPSSAERRSKQLVPYFLSWADDDATPDVPQESEESSAGSSWSLVDRKALLGVFSKFINPRVLYLHEKIYQGLLGQLSNGDVEIQKMALKAILAWKQEGVKPYQDNLEYLLDEARFKNELTVFLQGENVIKSEHRAELMPVLLRLLYGRSISKKGAASGRQGLHATRLAVLRNLSVEDMGPFLEIAAGPLGEVQIVELLKKASKHFETPLISVRRQMGYLNMITSLISELGANVEPYMPILINSVLYCLVFANRHITQAPQPKLSDSLDNDDEEEAEDEDDPLSNQQGMLKSVRATGLKCLNALFQNGQKFQWEPYHEAIIQEIVTPRAKNLPAENAQGVSGLLQLLSTWSKLPKSALLLGPQGPTLPGGILPRVLEILRMPKAKVEARTIVLDMIESLARLALAPAQESEFNDIIQSDVIETNIPLILDCLSIILESSETPVDLLDKCIDTMLALAPILRQSNNVGSILKNTTFLLQQPARRVNPRTKGKILLVLEDFVKLLDMNSEQSLWYEIYNATSTLFSYFKDRENRQSLSRVMLALAEQNEEIQEVADLCVKLNAFQERRFDEPDYDKRLEAFNAISLDRDEPLTPKQWLPLLHNAIFFMSVDEEFGVLSSNASDALRQIIRATAESGPGMTKETLQGYLKTVLLPALFSGAKESSETVRRAHLRVFSKLLTSLPQWEPVADMVALQPREGEENAEPAFFFNILSPAVARQLEALRELEIANTTSEIGSQNLAQFFIPLLEHFIYGRADGFDDHGLGAQAADTIGQLALSLDWKHYRTILGRYISYIASRPEQLKATMRVLGKFTDALTASTEASSPDSMAVDDSSVSPARVLRLQKTVPAEAKLHSDITDGFLPPLVKHLHEKDESEVSYRVPVGVIVVKLMRILPDAQMAQRLAGVLTDICHILRSKAVEARDMARDTLVKIAVILGPSYFGFLLKELRSALTRGYQLHVLSYTMHSILVALMPQMTAGDLDYCLPGIVMIIMDDIFGVIGQEKDAEGYTNQAKEIRSSKSQDSMELAAKTASITRLIELVKPLQALLQQKVDLKMVRKIETLLTRISSGLVQNPAAQTRDTLVFCYEIIQEVYKSQEPKAEPKFDPRVKKYLVQRGAKKNDRGTTTKHTYKIVSFAFDILRSTFKKHDDLRTTGNIEGFIPIIGDAIVDGEDDVKMAAFRLLGAIVKVPLESADIYKVAVREATKSISNSTSTTTDLSQAALKMLAVVFRDRREVLVKDAAVDVLLEKLKDDLTQPLYRHVTFNFLRSVLERRIETATVYDTMDYVGTVMITNDDKDTRDLARGAFFQFIREYPQTKARWAKQLNFVVANLKYDREGGRLSVMEMIHLLLKKASDAFVQEVVGTCFIPLFMVLANDDSDKCRLAAGQLIKEIFGVADKQQTRKFLGLLRSWLDKDDNPLILTVTLLVFDHYFEASEGAAKNKTDYELVMRKITNMLAGDIPALEAQLVIRALGVIGTLMETFPSEVLSEDGLPLLGRVAVCLKHQDAEVKLTAMKLIAAYLADFTKAGGKKGSGDVVMFGSHGLPMPSDTMSTLLRLALGVLNGSEVEEALATEAGQVLIFLGPRLTTGEAPSNEEAAEEEEDADETAEDVEADGEDNSRFSMDLQRLFTKLSTILRKEVAPRAIAINGKTTAMEVLETICRRSANERLEASFKTILTPLHNLTDPSIPSPYSHDEVFKTKHEALKTRAQILMDSLQKKFGTAEYSRKLMEIREEIRERRQQRISKRKIEAIAHPEKYGRDKRKKFEREKERRKIRGKEHREMRQQYKGW